MRGTNDSQSEVNQETEEAVTLEPKKNDYNVSQNSTESTLPKSISGEGAHYSSDPLLANNSANLNKVLNETANQRQEDRKQRNTDGENHIENDEGNQFSEVVDSGKHCSVISPKNVLRVSYAEILKQPIRKSQSCDSSDSHDITECDLMQGDQSYLEVLQSLGDPFEHEVHDVRGIDSQDPLYQIMLLI